MKSGILKINNLATYKYLRYLISISASLFLICLLLSQDYKEAYLCYRPGDPWFLSPLL